MENAEQRISDLQAENYHLRAKLEQYEREARFNGDSTDRFAQITKTIDKISDQLKAYGPIAEDVWGLRVFEKAKSYLVGWITLGGITVVITGAALFAGAWKYAIDLID